jgi:hypothetical protein
MQTSERWLVKNPVAVETLRATTRVHVYSV